MLTHSRLILPVARPSSLCFLQFFIDEVDIATGARLQTIAVPADPALGGCVTQQNFLTDSVSRGSRLRRE